MNDVTVNQGTNPVKYDPKVLGAGADVDVRDISVGRIAVMSTNSAMVTEEKAKAGDIIDLETSEVLGHKEKKPMEVILLKSFKYWITKKGDDFIEKTPGTHQNEKPWTEGDITNMFHHSFYVLIPKQVKEMTELPYELAFRSTDLATARKISKMLLTMARRGEASWNRKFKITAVQKTNGKHTWYGTDVEPGDITTDEERQAAFTWHNQMNAANTVSSVKAEERSSDVDADDVPF